LRRLTTSRSRSISVWVARAHNCPVCKSANAEVCALQFDARAYIETYLKPPDEASEELSEALNAECAQLAAELDKIARESALLRGLADKAEGARQRLQEAANEARGRREAAESRLSALQRWCDEAQRELAQRRETVERREQTEGVTALLRDALRERPTPLDQPSFHAALALAREGLAAARRERLAAQRATSKKSEELREDLEHVRHANSRMQACVEKAESELGVVRALLTAARQWQADTEAAAQQRAAESMPRREASNVIDLTREEARALGAATLPPPRAGGGGGWTVPRGLLEAKAASASSSAGAGEVGAALRLPEPDRAARFIKIGQLGTGAVGKVRTAPESRTCCSACAHSHTRAQIIPNAVPDARERPTAKRPAAASRIDHFFARKGD
jgi:hypothetical protein